ncbi:MAG: hypothetical protein CVV64_17380 [Candidatus Wallbacteria bacterium HGW-Wallbacteria-1]|jgi:hypothetical protein|uniref:Uncharacterized protein n=1 Tax=Candidatus Wallbacteria bacterium HGW-Wallbacteria-1 TaxID=2013854 RepID=A0A2N1PKG5_9BACT|nr:MAG: hypothetical protein CVV64_17380 [Candidatus Wallbacteria bacterium HGW-Wallbacteria-1]
MELDVKGTSLTFQFYHARDNSIVSFAKDAEKEENRLFVPDEQSGFEEVIVDDDGEACFATYGAIIPFDVERIDKEGKIVNETYFRVDRCGIMIFRDAVLMSGRPAAQREAAEALSTMLMKEVTPIKFDQAVMSRFETNFILIKSIQLDEIPHAEVKKVRLAGKIEDVYAFSGLNVSMAKIKSISGTYRLADRDYVTVKTADGGKLTIFRKKGKGIEVEVIRYFKDFILTPTAMMAGRGGAAAESGGDDDQDDVRTDGVTEYTDVKGDWE